MFFKKYFKVSVLFFICAMVGCSPNEQDQVVFVRLNDVFRDYDRMKEADKIVASFQEKQEYKLLGKYENLKSTMDDFESMASSMSESQKEVLLQRIEEKKTNLSMLETNMQSQTDSLYNSHKLLVVEDINRFIRAYAKEQNFSYVLGNWEDGHIMYGRADQDITTQVIKGLNEEYQTFTK